MRNRIQKISAYILLFTLVFPRVLFAIPYTIAQEAVPTVPSVPTVPPPPDSPPPPLGIPPPSQNTSNYTWNPTVPTVPIVPSSPPPPTGNVINNPESTGYPTVPVIPTVPTIGDSSTYPASSPAGSNDPTPTGEQTTENGAAGYGSESTDSNGSIVNDPLNANTGPFSSNYASEIVDKKMEELNKNLAELNNKIDAVTATGFNFANYNTLDGLVFSGSTLNTLNLLNKLNSNMTGLGGFATFNVFNTYVGDIVFSMASPQIVENFNNAATTISENDFTGPFSTNTAFTDNSFTVKEANGNDAQITNDINLQSITGGNSASFNTGSGVVQTGNASALANIVNMTNTNLNVSQWLFGIVNIFGTLAGNIILPQDTNTASSNEGSNTVYTGNTLTGPGSTNNATYNNSDITDIANFNNADITSNVTTSANSGNNASNFNTGGGIIATGDTDVSVSNTTVANYNVVQEEGTVWLVIVNEMGKWVGHILGAPWESNVSSNSLPVSTDNNGAGTQTYTLSQNTGTGPYSNNNAVYNNTSDTSIENTNDAKITNNITANSDTGNNQTSFNTGTGYIQTGDANTGVNLVNLANINVVAQKFAVVLVNVLGSFLGDVVPPDQEAVKSFDVANYAVPSPTKMVIPSPTPTTYKPPAFENGGNNIGGEQQENEPETTAGSDSYYTQVNTYYSVSYEPQNNPYLPPVYTQAVIKVQNQKTKLANQRKVYYAAGTSIADQIQNSTAGKVRRGLFLSETFTKATQSTIGGILLGGFQWKVSEQWLSIVPIAILIVFLRRRRHIQVSKYININALLEVLL